MPVIVVGADTKVGRAVLEAFLSGYGEIRAFVTDAESGEAFKVAGAKVAVGDVSDATHIGGAALNAHTAVLIVEAASDARERAFASDAEGVFAAWGEGLADAGVTRAIWVGDAPSPPVITGAVREPATVAVGGRAPAAVAADIVDLDDRSAWS